MEHNEKQQLVLDWIESGCDYDRGVMLYNQYGKNAILKKSFPGKEYRLATKLVYELCKSVGLNYGQLKEENKIPVIEMPMIPSTPEEGTKVLNNVKGKVVSLPTKETGIKTPINEFTEPETIETKNIEQYPAPMRRVISEYAEMFQERSKTHRIMTDMPEGNSQTLKTKRAELFDMVKGFTIRMGYLYEIRTEYDKTGFVPADDEIWPKPKEKVKTVLPDLPEELRKMKKNQQSANTKDQNMLDYQSEKQGTVKNTMPTGPKRMKLENRIKARLKMIEEIEYKLVKV